MRRQREKSTMLNFFSDMVCFLRAYISNTSLSSASLNLLLITLFHSKSVSTMGHLKCQLKTVA